MYSCSSIFLSVFMLPETNPFTHLKHSLDASYLVIEAGSVTRDNLKQLVHAPVYAYACRMKYTVPHRSVLNAIHQSQEHSCIWCIKLTYCMYFSRSTLTPRSWMYDLIASSYPMLYIAISRCVLWTSEFSCDAVLYSGVARSLFTYNNRPHTIKR